jgi:hypothetical protein
MSELDPRLERHVARLREVPAVRPEAVASLHAALRGGVAAERRGIVLTPAAAGALVVLVALLTSVGWLVAGRAGAPATDGRTPVQFVLHATGAASVTLVGDFNDWDARATPLSETGDGVWSVVVPLPAGSVRYSFLVDGSEWRADPSAAAAPGDFGRPTSVALVLAPEVMR